MRCSCQNCGEYMVQSEKGLDSGCVCPECLTRCTACMGAMGAPKSAEELRLIARLRLGGDEEEAQR
ncbi:MAG: hypothetical protein Q4C04_01195 [Clostridia bacterium]|nr:hypothetical protein [Clostridia bacterium]